MAVLSTSDQSAIQMDQGYLRAKRILDVVFTLLFLIPLCIVIVVFVVLIRLDSKGPAFFRQKRVGRNGIEFYMLKLRSMYVDADDSIHRESVKLYMNGAKLNGNGDFNSQYKLSGDPRITKIGRFIRKTSIDELPQFINVLRGEMTLVGPRPPLHYEVEAYGPREWLRLCGKPGLTGTWQVYGRSRVPFEKMIEMDIEYLEHQSLLKDIQLIALTLPVMLKSRGGA
jgi:lipopolysaccharide/colanic/teichoic acid biosynthesis glycosyltransferase